MARKKKIESIPLAEGIQIEEQYARQMESRLITLLLKGVIVFLLVFGVIGGVLSAFQIAYSVKIFALVVMLASLYCALLYYNKLWENIGYLLLLFFMAAVGFSFRVYINSGFNSFMNQYAEAMTMYLNLDVEKSYGEVRVNHWSSLTVAASYIGCVASMMTNIFVSRRMRYVLVGSIGMVSFAVPMYLEKEPGAIYVICFVVGVLLTIMLKRSGHFALSGDNNAYQYDRKKGRLTYRYAGKVVGKTMVAVLILCVGIVGLFGLFCPRDWYSDLMGSNALKEKSKPYVAILYTQGIYGLLNEYDNEGGLSTGELGGISSVTLDYETDFTMDFVPYSYDRMYLKTFEAGEYLPVDNRWSAVWVDLYHKLFPKKYSELQLEEFADIDQLREAYPDADEEELKLAADCLARDEVSWLKAGYEQGKDGFVKARIRLKNETLPETKFEAYYSEKHVDMTLGGIVSLDYYPRLADAKKHKASTLQSDLWKRVPEENIETIAKFCEEQGFSSDMQAEEVIDRLKEYFQEEIPYTLHPGKTPRNEDFVNYFLEEQKKGYCAHYASAATLILRYLGIPARYVEGYAIDGMDLAQDANLLGSEKAEDFYQGKNSFGGSAVVRYEVSDGNAHAWVEVYEEETGWVPVEFTPSSSEEEKTSLLAMFMGLFQSGRSQNAASDGATELGQGVVGAANVGIRMIACLVLAAILLCAVAYLMLRRKINPKGKTRNERALYYFRRYLERNSVEYNHRWSVEEALGWLVANKGMEEQICEEFCRILNQAAYSSREISVKDYELVRTRLKKKKKM